MTGFEPATPCTPCKYATELRHIPIFGFAKLTKFIEKTVIILFFYFGLIT